MIQRLTKLPTPLFLVGAFAVGFWLMLQSRAALLFLMALYGAIFTMVGCGQPPTLTTAQGIEVYVDETSDEPFADDVYSAATYTYIFDTFFNTAGNILNRKPGSLEDRVVDSGMYVFVTPKDIDVSGDFDVRGYYTGAAVVMENRQPGDLRILAHEMCHAMQYLLEDGFIDYEHEAPKYFGESGIEALVKQQILAKLAE
jgi:hypothetical protein